MDADVLDGDRITWIRDGLASVEAPALGEARADGTYGNDDGTFDFVASTEEVDRYDSVIEQKWRLRNFRANPVVLYEHAVPVVGRATVKIGEVDRKSGPVKALFATVRFDESELNPTAMLVAHQHREGFRKAVSVRFRPGKVIARTKLATDHPAYIADDIPEWRAPLWYGSPELLELSPVAVPGSAAALQLRAHAMEVDDPDEQVARWLREAAPRQLRELLRDFLADRPEAARVVRSVVLGTPLTPPAAAGTPTIPWIRSGQETTP